MFLENSIAVLLVAFMTFCIAFITTICGIYIAKQIKHAKIRKNLKAGDKFYWQWNEKNVKNPFINNNRYIKTVKGVSDDKKYVLFDDGDSDTMETICKYAVFVKS